MDTWITVRFRKCSTYLCVGVIFPGKSNERSMAFQQIFNRKKELPHAENH
ncbi:MAG: hypothetical protein M3R08_09400 [Bacteroidota bacterium]|nr:hypothetical protein [Bacteroidota bacterium]